MQYTFSGFIIHVCLTVQAIMHDRSRQCCEWYYPVVDIVLWQVGTSDEINLTSQIK